MQLQLQRIDTAAGRALVKTIDLVALAESYGVGPFEKKGAEMVALCPFHVDGSPSLNINPKKGLYVCRACGSGGSAVDFVVEAEALKGNPLGTGIYSDVYEAFLILEAGTAGGTLPQAERTAGGEKPAPWVALSVVPPSAPPADFRHHQHGLPTRTWAYKNATGQLLGYVCRFDFTDGRKDLLPLSYAEKNGFGTWKWLSFGVPRPLYGLDKLAEAPATVPVLVVEGEKAADAANSLFFPALVAIAWPGGSNGVTRADWTPLRGRNVIVWPDADEPGRAAMFGRYDKQGDLHPGIAQLAAEAGALAVRAVLPPADLPVGWDVADGARDGWDRVAASAFLTANITAPPAPVNKSGKVEKATAKPAAPRSCRAVKPDMEAGADEAPDEVPYRALGFRKTPAGQGEFWFYSYKAQQAYRFVSANFTKSGLLQLADSLFWKTWYGGSRTDGYELAAAQSLMNACYAVGVYDPERVRGTGAWLDGDRVVVHAGTHLVAGGREFKLKNFSSHFLYEADKSFGFQHAEPLSSKEATRFYELANLMRWERPAYADLFLGWCVVAPVCGALNWRPHLWLTGEAGTGKTLAFDILADLLGPIALRVQGGTTEPAIRGLLRSNAQPVLFDEADTDSRADNERIQAILSLARASSSHGGGSIAKGSAGGGAAQTFLVRSCFAFASITPKVANSADRSRVTVLSLVKPGIQQLNADEAKEKMAACMAELLTPERCESLRARTLAHLPELIANARVFSRAAALVLNEQRAGDQLGVLLAGAYSLKRTDLVTFEDAKKWIENRDWSEIQNNEKDQDACLSHILEQLVRVESRSGTSYEKSVADLVEIVADGVKGDEILTTKDAGDRLRRMGVKVEDGFLYIANKSVWLTRTLSATSWSANHGKVLSRLPGAEVTQKLTYFTTATKQRAVKIPLDLLRADG